MNRPRHGGCRIHAMPVIQLKKFTPAHLYANACTHTHRHALTHARTHTHTHIHYAQSTIRLPLIDCLTMTAKSLHLSDSSITPTLILSYCFLFLQIAAQLNDTFRSTILDHRREFIISQHNLPFQPQRCCIIAIVPRRESPPTFDYCFIIMCIAF